LHVSADSLLPSARIVAIRTLGARNVNALNPEQRRYGAEIEVFFIDVFIADLYGSILI